LNAIADCTSRRPEAARFPEAGAVAWIAPSELRTTGAPNTASMLPDDHARLAMAGEDSVAATALMSLLVP
jgi:hypothetical protein